MKTLICYNVDELKPMIAHKQSPFTYKTYLETGRKKRTIQQIDKLENVRGNS